MEEQKSRLRSAVWIAFVFALLVAASAIPLTTRAQAEAGPIKPLNEPERPLDARQLRAQQLALASSPVQRYAQGSRAEVFTVLPFTAPYDSAYAACQQGTCYQVDIFDFTQRATITAIVDVDSDKALDAWLTPNSHPLITPSLYRRAWEIMRTDPDVVTALGYQPTLAQTRMMDTGSIGTRCVGGYLCAGATFMTDSGAVWVLVDLIEERIEKMWWEDKPFDLRSNQDKPKPEAVPTACGDTTALNRNGWKMNYRITPTDGLEVTGITWNVNGVDQPVATRLKLMEWHARYPSGSGYRDYIGCGGGAGGGFPIYFYGGTQVRDLYDVSKQVIGFAVVQDFRMSNWLSACNYRYEQHFEFYNDGSFRVKTGSYGRGCGNSQLNEATYRPVVFMDLAVAGDAGDTFAVWDGSQWVNQNSEGWWLQAAPYNADGDRYRIIDQSGFGYTIEPGQGQFNDNGTGDNAYLYLTLHRASEGDADTGALPDTTCCNQDYRQGPHYWVNNEATADQNLTLWYVPAGVTITTWAVNNGYGTRQYCWSDSAANTWPCFAGPLFKPFSSGTCSLYDFDCNNAVDTGDVTAIATLWNCLDGDACYDPEYDLDADSDIDVNDVMMDAARWNCSLGQGCYW